MSSTDTLNFDAEFSIPNIYDDIPSLEQILTKDDDFSLVDQMIEQDLNLSINDQDYNSSVYTKTDFQNESSFNLVELNFVKSQLILSQNDKIDSGKPTSLVVSKCFIGVGTFNGHIIMMGFNKTLFAFLKHDKDFGSISALSINKDETRLLCGSSKGHLSFWNLTNKEIIRSFDDLHAPLSSILFVKYLSNPNYAILNDSSGSVFFLDTRKKDLGSQCIFSGSRGETLTLKPLSQEEIPNIPIYKGLENLCLVGMGTVSKVIVISIRPSVVVHFTYTLKTNLDYLPLICWNLLFEYNGDITPIFTFARHDQLFIHKMSHNFYNKIEFIPLYQFTTTNYCLQHITWIENQKLFVMDTAENGHLIDVFVSEEIEKIDLSNIELIYENSHYKSLANGGYVSVAMSQAGTHACNNAFAMKKFHDKNQLFILGQKSLFVITLREWHEKVDYFLKENDHLKAFQLLYENYLLFKSRQLLSTTIDIDIEQILSKIDQSLDLFVENFQTNLNVINQNDENDAKEIISVYLKCAICLPNKHEKLFQLFEKMSTNESLKCSLIESMEQYLFDDEFPNLNPIIVTEIINYYFKKEWYNLLDSIITHLDITTLDIDYIIKIYSRYHLYDSFIYIYNCAMNDFILPFDTLMNILKESIELKKQTPKDDIIIGNKLLVYLNCMLTCVYYPNKGKIADDEQVEHLNNCYKRLTTRNDDNRLDILDVIFQHDCVEFLNIILIAFEFLDKFHPDLSCWKQVLIDQMISFIINNEQISFSNEHRNSFFIFLGRCLTDSFQSILIDDNYFEKMIDSLFKSEKRFEERQQILIRIFHCDQLRSRINAEHFLDNALQNKMYKICELIYQNNQEWIQLFDIYLNDSSKNDEIFSYIDFILSQNDNFFPNSEMKNEFLNNVFQKFTNLVKIDCFKAEQLFYSSFKCLPNLFQIVHDVLETDPLQLHRFLKYVILNNRIEFENISADLIKIKELCFDAKNQETLIELTCQFDPDDIINVLDSLKEYDPLNALTICKQFNVKDGQAFLYEKMKLFQKSFDILFQNFQQSFEILKDIHSDKIHLDFEKILAIFYKLLSFCDRIFKIDNENLNCENYWLIILEYLIQSKLNIKNKQNQMNIGSNEKNELIIDDLNKYFNILFENLINEMLTHLNLITFLEIIMDKLLQQKESICDIREMLFCILENYNYEKTLLELTTNMLSMEQNQLYNNVKLLKQKSINIKVGICLYCSSSLKGKFITFSCNHLLHLDCLESIRKEQSFKDITCNTCQQMIKFNLELVNSTNEIINGNDNKIMENSTRKCLNEVQMRILNNFHHNRLKQIRID